MTPMETKQRQEEQWWRPLVAGESLLSSDGPMMDFLEQTVEILFLWEDKPSRDVARYQAVASKDLLDLSSKTEGTRTTTTGRTLSTTTVPGPQRDYASMHDCFLESLLQEQAQNPHPLTRLDSFSLGGGPPPLTECHSDSASTMTSFASQDSTYAPPDAKKRRLVRLQRRHSTTPVLHQHSHHHYSSHGSTRRLYSSDDDDDDSTYAPKSVDLQQLSAHGAQLHPPPETFVHVHCRMQKDKGKGDVLGKDVCAEGREKCMDKLRQKMELLAQVALGNATPSVTKTKGKADMKRRKARVSANAVDYVETRSIIQLRMGFLSMQYGVLLQWDRTTHLIVFVLLRKMCSESFYHKTMQQHQSTMQCNKNSNRHSSRSSSMPSQLSSSSSPLGYVIKSVVNGNCAIVQRHGECEVVMLDPPYLVSRPNTFPPSLLSVNVLNVDGLNPKSTWIVKMIVRGVTQTLRLGWNPDDASFEPRNSDTMKLDWHVHDESSSSIVDLHMDMQLFEQVRGRSRQQRRRRLKTSLPVVPPSPLHVDPYQDADAAASTEAARSRFVVVPVNDTSSLTLSINFQSDYAQWLQQEVDARKQQDEQEEQVSSALWKGTPFFNNSTATANTTSTKTVSSWTTMTQATTESSSSAASPALIESAAALDYKTFFLNPFEWCCAW